MFRTQLQHLLLLLLLMTVIVPPLTEGRGGGRGGGRGLFSSWRKVKKPSSNSGSSRRQYVGGYTPLKSAPPPPPLPNKPFSAGSYPKQQMPPGATYHAHGSSLPAGATYHPSGYYGGQGAAAHVPPGGTYYANAASMPSGAVFSAQPISSGSSFSSTNFLFGMYAGQMLSPALHMPRVTHVTHVTHNSDGGQVQPQEANKDKVIIVENGRPSNYEASRDPDNAHFWPTDVDVPLAHLNVTTMTPEMQQSPATTVFQRQTATTESVEADATEVTAPTQVPAITGGIICLPMLLNETDASDASRVQQVEKIVCYPAPTPPTITPQTAANAGIICVPRQELAADATASTSPAANDDDVDDDVGSDDESDDVSKSEEMQQIQDCYPAPPPSSPPANTRTEEPIVTKSPESVIGNIVNEEALGAEDVIRRQMHAVLEELRNEEQHTMKDFLDNLWGGITPW